MLEFGGEQNFPTSVAFLIICFFVTPVCAILIRDNPPHHTAVDAGPWLIATSWNGPPVTHLIVLSTFLGLQL